VTSDEAPEYRASIVKTSLTYVRELERGDEILKALGPQVISEIESAPEAGFVPYAYHLSILEWLYGVEGKEGVRDLTAYNVAESIDGPLFKIVRKGFLKTFGLKPATLLNAVPRGMRKTTRHLGRIDIDVDPKGRGAKTIWHKIPEMARRPWVGEAHSGTYPVLLTWGGALDVRVELDMRRMEQGEFHYEVHWVE
jgi:hypothetical protein